MIQQTKWIYGVVFALSLSTSLLLQNGSCRNNKMRNAPNEKVEKALTGMWGGEHIVIDVTGEGATINYDCAHGTITQPLTLDNSGHFDAKGFHVKERGGPVREDDEGHSGQPARYTGRIDGKTMTLTVTLADTKEDVGTFTLTHGKAARIVKCL